MVLAPAVPRDNFAPLVRLKFYRGKGFPDTPSVATCIALVFGEQNSRFCTPFDIQS